MSALDHIHATDCAARSMDDLFRGEPCDCFANELCADAACEVCNEDEEDFDD